MKKAKRERDNAGSSENMSLADIGTEEGNTNIMNFLNTIDEDALPL